MILTLPLSRKDPLARKLAVKQLTPEAAPHHRKSPYIPLSPYALHSHISLLLAMNRQTIRKEQQQQQLKAGRAPQTNLVESEWCVGAYRVAPRQQDAVVFATAVPRPRFKSTVPAREVMS